MCEQEKLTILYVEDEIDILEEYTKTLSKEYNVIPVSSVKEARQIFFKRHKEIDIILTDYKMEDSNNCSYLKDLHEIDKKPTLVFTGYGDSVLMNANEIYWDITLKKPGGPSYLLNNIRRVVNDYKIERRCKEWKFSELIFGKLSRQQA